MSKSPFRMQTLAVLPFGFLVLPQDPVSPLGRLMQH